MRGINTPRPWQAGVQPTAEDLAGWLVILPRDELVMFAEQALRNADEAWTCLIEDHAGIADRLTEIHRSGILSSHGDGA